MNPRNFAVPGVLSFLTFVVLQGFQGPLGAPHGGPDVLENLLCLCPNHYVMFDLGIFTIAGDLSLIGLTEKLRTIPSHPI
jgi:putative restriction endonuclease